MEVLVLRNGKMKREEFESSLGKVYQVGLPDGGRVGVVLKETGDLRSPPESAPKGVRRDPFFLVFNGLGGEELPLGSLVVVGPDGSEYPLAFNAEGYIDGDPDKGLQYYVVVN